MGANLSHFTTWVAKCLLKINSPIHTLIIVDEQTYGDVGFTFDEFGQFGAQIVGVGRLRRHGHVESSGTGKKNCTQVGNGKEALFKTRQYHHRYYILSMRVSPIINHKTKVDLYTLHKTLLTARRSGLAGSCPLPMVSVGLASAAVCTTIKDKFASRLSVNLTDICIYYTYII